MFICPGVKTQCPYCDFSITTDPVNGNEQDWQKQSLKIHQSKDLIAGENLKLFILAEALLLLPPLNQSNIY